MGVCCKHIYEYKNLFELFPKPNDFGGLSSFCVLVNQKKTYITSFYGLWMWNTKKMGWELHKGEYGQVEWELLEGDTKLIFGFKYFKIEIKMVKFVKTVFV